MKLELRNSDKMGVFNEVEKYLNDLQLRIVDKDQERPWGGYFVIDEQQAQQFGKLFYPEINLADLRIGGKLSPKILLMQPGKRLSWQYHHRRSEIWRLIAGTTDVITSLTDVETDKVEMKSGDTIRLSQGLRHRAEGTKDWGIIAEIWQHTDASNPSDENDIVRVQDDYGR